MSPSAENPVLEQMRVIHPAHHSAVLTIYSQNPDDLSVSSPDPEPQTSIKVP